MSIIDTFELSKIHFQVYRDKMSNGIVTAGTPFLPQNLLWTVSLPPTFALTPTDAFTPIAFGGAPGLMILNSLAQSAAGAGKPEDIGE